MCVQFCYIFFFRLRILTRKPAATILFVSGRDAKCKEGLRVLDDGWRDTFCLTAAINPSDALSTAAVVDSVLR